MARGKRSRVVKIDFPDIAVKQQQEDETLWAVTDDPLTEKLQKALRRLHAAIEGAIAIDPLPERFFKHITAERMWDLEGILNEPTRYALGPMDTEDLISLIVELRLRRECSTVGVGQKTDAKESVKSQ